jgi:uncharacterized damage-inducible protein DinB
MNLADSLRRQFAYDVWANQEVIRAIHKASGAKERAVELMSHILAAERVWLERLKKVPQSGPVWPKPNLEQCEAEATEMGRLWSAYLELMTAGDATQTISYKNTKGEEWSNTIVDVLTHVILHSTYHRGQIASFMRSSGDTPAYTDYIHAIRQEFVK